MPQPHDSQAFGWRVCARRLFEPLGLLFRAANAVRLQLHALACNLGNFLRTLAAPEPIKEWSLTSLRAKLIEIGAKLVSRARYVAFHMAEVAAKRLLAEILRLN